MSSHTQFKARYDAKGNIVLEFLEEAVSDTKNVMLSEAQASDKDAQRGVEAHRLNVNNEGKSEVLRYNSPLEEGDEHAGKEGTSVQKEKSHAGAHPPLPEGFTQHDVQDDVKNDVASDVQHAFHSTKISSPRRRFASEALRFAGTFTAVFLALFFLLNFESYARMARATLLPETTLHEENVLRRVTHDGVLPLPPALPSAGRAAGGGIPGIPEVAPIDDRIIIPKIGLNVPMVQASDASLRRGDFTTFEADVQNALLHGAVHYPGTAAPGQPGNVFITGHSSNYPWIQSNYNSVFALLPRLELGDTYSVFFRGELHQYRIVEKKEISPRDVSVLKQPSDRYTSTLMTCTPVGTTLRRLILLAEEVDPATGDVIAVEKSPVEAPKVDAWGEALPT